MAVCAVYELQENLSYSCIDPDPPLQDMDLACKGFIFNILYNYTDECVEFVKYAIGCICANIAA